MMAIEHGQHWSRGRDQLDRLSELIAESDERSGRAPAAKRRGVHAYDRHRRLGIGRDGRIVTRSCRDDTALFSPFQFSRAADACVCVSTFALVGSGV